MKKTILKKTITMLLVLTLVFSLAATASAGSYNWTSGDSQYAAILTVGTSATTYTRTSFWKYHAVGTATTITATSGGSYSKSANTALASQYSGNIGTLMAKDGYSDRVSYYVSSGRSIEVPANKATGNYYMTVDFDGAALNITVRQHKVDSDGNPYLVNTELLHSDYTPKTYGCTLGYVKG